MIDQKAYWRDTRSFYGSPTKYATRLFAESKLTFIAKFLRLENDAYILDVGAGNGIFTYHFAKHSRHVVGVDISERLIRGGPCSDKILLADAFSLPFKDDTFDMAFTSCLLHHVEAPGKVIGELLRTSKKYIVLCEPNRDNPVMFLFSLLVECERKGIRFSKRYLKDLAGVYQNLKILTLVSQGAITPNLTPSCVSPFLRLFERQWRYGCYNILIAQKLHA